MPRPRSESMLAVLGDSRITFQLGRGLIWPLLYPSMYDRSMLDTPWVSTPRRSATTSTSAARRASAAPTPIFSKMDATMPLRSSPCTYSASSRFTRKISSKIDLLQVPWFSQERPRVVASAGPAKMGVAVSQRSITLGLSPNHRSTGMAAQPQGRTLQDSRFA